MGLLQWFSTGGVDEYARQLADGFAGIFTQEMAANWLQDRKKVEKKLSSAIKTTYRKAEQLQREHEFGTFKKARITNTFRWQLEELGYDKQLIANVTEGRRQPVRRPGTRYYPRRKQPGSGCNHYRIIPAHRDSGRDRRWRSRQHRNCHWHTAVAWRRRR